MYEIMIIFLLVLFNGLLAMSEIALLTVKKFRLEEKAKKNNQSAIKAINLINEPEKLLSTIQIGITLIGIVAGAYGGYTLAEELTPHISQVELLKPYAAEISFISIVTLITYLSLVIGELVPKRIAIYFPEKISLLMAHPLYIMTKIFAPFVAFMSLSTKFILYLLPEQKEEPPVTEDEFKSLLELGEEHGTFEKEETEMIKKILSFNDKKVSSIIIPRTEMDWINLSMTNEEVFRFISNHPYSKYPVFDTDIDNFIGFVQAKEFLIKYFDDKNFDLRTIAHDPVIVPETIYTIDMLEKFRTTKTNIALIIDEYGGTLGIVTLHDLMENIFGDLPEKHEKDSRKIIQRKDGSFLIDGLVTIKEVSELLDIDFKSVGYTTMSGFIMHQIGKIPEEGEIIFYNNYHFEIVDMDGKRIDKLLVKKAD